MRIRAKTALHGTDNPPPGEDYGDPNRCKNTPLTKCRTGCPANHSGTCGPDMQPFHPGGPSCNLCPCNEHNTTCANGGDKNTEFPSHVHIFKLPGVATADLEAKCGCKEAHAGQSPCSKPAYFTGKQPFSAGFHTASLNWTTDATGLSTIAIGVDGTIVNTITSPCLVEEIGMDFEVSM